MSNQNVWDDVDIFGVRIFEPNPSLTIKKNVGTGYISSWKFYLTFILLLAMFISMAIIAMPEYFFKVSKPMGMSGRDEVGFFRITFLIGYLLIYGCTYGKMKFTGETEQFWQYTRTYFFTSFVFALALIFFCKSGWWFWLSFIFFCFGILCFFIAAVSWSKHKKLVYQFAWENLGDGQKFLIIQKGHDVMLYELKDKINEVEYEKIVQQKKTLIK
ncbi:MAG: hypothetical protein CVV39_07120 [Planctomycetes bacterium HGW-Planctomycetes-1]|nr:MAG: hypothetical protein CVV39_07120 [Planctomycetes bacterium HGW-Planctomycetes-1]